MAEELDSFLASTHYSQTSKLNTVNMEDELGSLLASLNLSQCLADLKRGG